MTTLTAQEETFRAHGIPLDAGTSEAARFFELLAAFWGDGAEGAGSAGRPLAERRRCAKLARQAVAIGGAP